MREKLEIPSRLFVRLITKLRAHGIDWTTWRIEGENHVYTGRKNMSIIRSEIDGLKEREDGG